MTFGVAGFSIVTAALPLSVSKKQGSEAVPQRWTPAAISTDGYESSPTFTPDGRSMYFISADRNFRNFQVVQSHCGPGGWSRAAPASFAKPLPVIEADPFVTYDGKRLFFISSRHSPADEDFDIYSVDRLPNGEWGEPRRLPEPVNSKGAELLPRMDRRGNLYFGSDRPGGLGLGDIYVAVQDKAGQWKVRNLGAPVNTAGHEFEAEISRDGREMVIVADRPGPAHLYRYKLRSGRWVEFGRVFAKDDMFQIGPLLSPKGDRLLFAQKDGDRSGEMFLTDLSRRPDKSWPPKCE